MVVGVGGDSSGGGGEPRGLGERRNVEGEEETVKESRRIFVNTEKASSRRAAAWSLVGRKSWR